MFWSLSESHWSLSVVETPMRVAQPLIIETTKILCHAALIINESFIISSMPFIYKFYAFIFLARSLSCSCSPEIRESGFEKAKKQYSVREIGRLPREVNESSGLVHNADGTLWTHNDSGGKSELYQVDATGNLLETKALNIPNVDWEEIALGKENTLFVGDIGNNDQNRKDLCIYKIANNRTERIGFSYGVQTEFPPKSNFHEFDSEAFFWYKDKLFLFSKSTLKSDRTVKMYELPDHGGQYKIFAKDSIYLKTAVTAASVNPAGTEFALMTYGKLFIFGIENEAINFKRPISCLKISKKQTEAITYINNTDLVLSNEQGQLFLVEKKQKHD